MRNTCPDLAFSRNICLMMILLGLPSQQFFAQSVILEQFPNRYASIQQILAYDENDVDSVVVANADDFDPGDTVMIYCVQGAEIRLNNPDIGRDNQNPRNTGKYAFLIIDEKIGTTLTLNTTVRPGIGPLGPGEVAQLIRVPSYHLAEVPSGGVTAPEWNPLTGTGGIVALFVRTTLKLNGNIDVSGCGFRGASESTLYPYDCSADDPDLFDSAFYHENSIRAGLKGEGTTDTLFHLMRGWASNINGGGGGNGKYAGGGGGSNCTGGGRGGDESSLCPSGVENPGGAGGFDLGRSDSYYLNKSEDLTQVRFDRIFLGGGGGTGTRTASRTTTAGGNGGGVVVILADTIDGNGGHWILANGADVSGTATGAAGGGGGGGVIALDVSGYKNNLRLSAVGGKGGNTFFASDTTGPGGGGGGGIYWLAGTEAPGVSPVTDLNGKKGEYLSTPHISYGAADGNFPCRKDGLDAPLRGFLFNSVPNAFWVCSDQVPSTIFASLPKGGDGTYAYQWLDSSATQNQWLPAPGTNDQQHYAFPASLDDTTYFRRVVTAPNLPGLKPDTSFRIAVYVHHAITNNVVSAPDTVCWGKAPMPFNPVGNPGAGLGSGSYEYRWVMDEGSGSYTNATGDISQPGYQAPGLEITTHFARIVSSGVCVDTSDALTVTVFDTLVNNLIQDDDTICWNTRPDLITGPVPGGGDEPDKRYRWQSGATENGPWTDEGISTKDYRPDPLTSTTWFHRIALSGSDDACVDTSNAVQILNIDTIENNRILTADQTVCTFDQPDLLSATPGQGGDGSSYAYLWESRTATTGWVAADNSNENEGQNYLPPVQEGDSMLYRRIVRSGGQEGVCRDTTPPTAVHVLPSITGNGILSDVTMNCQYDFVADLTQDPAEGVQPGGGATQGGNDLTRHYKWEQANGMTEPQSGWTEISYGDTELDFTDPFQMSSVVDYWFRRIVFSGPDLGGQSQVCSDTSEPVHIVIHTTISNNVLDAEDSVCHQIEKVLLAPEPEGETGLTASYSWKDADNGTALGTSQDLAYTFTTLDARRFVREVTIGECEDTSNTMVITVMELPGGTLSGDLTKACEKTIQLDVDLHMESLTRYTIPWEVSLSDGVNPGLTEPQALEADGQVDVELSTEEISTQYDYTIGKLSYFLTDGTECTAPDTNLLGHVPIEVFLTPEPEITIETDLTDQAVCDNEITLVADPDHGTGTWSSNYPDYLGFLPDPSALNVRASIDPNDSLAWLNIPYVLYFTSQAGDCWGIDSVEITFYEQPEQAYAGADDTIYLSNSTWLDADPATAGEGTWTVTSGAGIFEDEHDPKTFVYGLAKGERNEFLWTIINGVCITSDDRSVITQDKAQPYEGFSPNGDGINDYFIIRGLGSLEEGDEFEIHFFNALGRPVRTVTQENIREVDYDEAMIPGGLKDYEAVVWDGRARDSKGPLVPPGTYYYVIRITKKQADGSIDEPEEKHFVVVRE